MCEESCDMLTNVLHSFVNVFCATVSCLVLQNEANIAVTPRHNLHSGKDSTSDSPIVHTKYGGVAGYKMASVTNRVIYAFEGIPFAGKRLHDLVFRTQSKRQSVDGMNLIFRIHRRRQSIQGNIMLKLNLKLLIILNARQ